MSSLLEQAIIDAQQLREAALKSAESAVVEKYSHEIKNIMNEILEDEDPLAEAEPGAPEPEEGLPPGAEEDVPLAALDGEKACPCPDDVTGEDGEIEIDLDQLAASASVAAQDTGPAGPPEAAGDMPLQEQEDVESDLATEELETNDQDSSLEEISLDFDEDISITEEDIASILEELDINVDLQAVGRGWAGQSRAESEEQIHQNLAALKDKEKGAERIELLNKIDELEESIAKQETTLVEYKTLAENLAEKLEGVNLSNAKLLYINKTLGAPSLNERQIQTVVEAISKAKTAEEAKVIFETLQSTVGASSNREALPQSLSEAVNRKKPAMLVSRPMRSEHTENKVMQNFADRMRKLAGIDRT